jgi:hypothetical protein
MAAAEGFKFFGRAPKNLVIGYRELGIGHWPLATGSWLSQRQAASNY